MTATLDDLIQSLPIWDWTVTYIDHQTIHPIREDWMTLDPPPLMTKTLTVKARSVDDALAQAHVTLSALHDIWYSIRAVHHGVGSTK
jgi:hypothetical protein